MDRTILPNRRRSFRREAVIDGESFSIDVGFAPGRHGGREDNPVLEVFANGPKIGSTMQAIVSDACVVISLALQYGVQPADLAKSLGRVPQWHDGQEKEGPASVIGLIVEALQAEDIE